ncbi:MAG: Tim44 domain-containing protein [Hylemonella sp.]
MMKFLTLALALVLALGGLNAEAKRLSGGKSTGKQSSNVTQREAAPNTPASPAQNAATAPAKPAPAATPGAAPTPAKKPWGAMLGGLAAGLGLAWLAHSMGFGEEFGQFMLIAMVVLLAMVAIGWFMRNRRAASTTASPYAFQGAGAGADQAATPRNYRPENVGNDASARPWERSTTNFDAEPAPRTSGVVIGSALAGGSQNWSVPADFDTAGFLRAAKENFIAMQAAWDRMDLPALRVMMTDEMMNEIRQQLADQAGGNQTEVVMLEAQLLGIEELANEYMASVEFSGMIREEPSAGPSPFREVWNMTKSKHGNSGWLVAGVQALQ